MRVNLVPFLAHTFTYATALWMQPAYGMIVLHMIIGVQVIGNQADYA